MNQLDTLIGQLVQDIEGKDELWAKAQVDRSQSRMDVCTHQRLGLTVGLGRVLAVRDGAPAESDAEALFRGNTYLNQR